ncbi:hypothetical protein [Nocardia salmonicida]
MTVGMTIIGYAVLNANLIEEQIRAGHRRGGDLIARTSFRALI